MTGRPLDVSPADPELERALAAYTSARPLLLAVDFDGVLAPLVDDPDRSAPLPASTAALTRIAGANGVVSAYVSGRDLAGLTAVAQADERALLIGSHGAEWPDALQAKRSQDGLSQAQAGLLARVTAELEQIVATHPGTRVERKPTTAVLHTRLADPDVGAEATRRALTGPAALPGVKVTPGKDVVEMAVTSATKGQAVVWLGRHLQAARTCYLGDDVTDETVFEVLGADDLTIKVGPGETAARYRVASPDDVAAVLTRIAELLGH